jgi:hypothetical protein
MPKKVDALMSAGSSFTVQGAVLLANFARRLSGTIFKVPRMSSGADKSIDIQGHQHKITAVITRLPHPA